MSDWPHSPAHRFPEEGAYIVTGATYRKEHLFNTPERLTLLQDLLFELAGKYGWQLQAWAVFSNHYHFVAASRKKPETVRSLINHLHGATARAINREDGISGRKVWFQYWDTLLSYERSYLARLNYVHNNPVKHGLVLHAQFYHWCSARWFNEQSDSALREMVTATAVDRVNVIDDF